MKRFTDIFFSISVLILLSLPMLYFAGAEEEFVRLRGVEHVPQPLPVTAENYWTKEYQKNFDEIYSKKFFLRKSFFKLKNQLYAFCNFGYFYSSKLGLKGNSDGWLVGHGYLWSYYSNLPVDEKKYKACFELLGKVAEEFRKKGIDFIYVLAPDKVFMYPERLPSFYSLYLKRTAGAAPHADYGRILEKYRVPYFDAYSFLYRHKSGMEIFPARGIHWTAPAACLTVAEMMRQLNRNRRGADRYPVPVPLRFEKTEPPRYGEYDIANLTNLVFTSKQSGLQPVFAERISPKTPLTPSVMLVGDSFTAQLAVAMSDSRMFARIFKHENLLPGVDEFCQELSICKLFVLVYTTPKLLNPMERHEELRRVYEILRYHDDVRKAFPCNNIVPFNDLWKYFSQLEGFYAPEPQGRWAGRMPCWNCGRRTSAGRTSG